MFDGDIVLLLNLFLLLLFTSSDFYFDCVAALLYYSSCQLIFVQVVTFIFHLLCCFSSFEFIAADDVVGCFCLVTDALFCC